MKHTLTGHLRVLAIDPTTRGFGFAVLEGAEMLIDWGVKETREDKNENSLNLISDLIDRYQQDVLVTENCKGKDSRRCHRVQGLTEDILRLCEDRKIRSRLISRFEVRKTFSQYEAFTKHQIAKVIAKEFPELTPRVPPYRKPWMSEDYRMAIFDAIAFAITYFQLEDDEENTHAEPSK